MDAPDWFLSENRKGTVLLSEALQESGVDTDDGEAIVKFLWSKLSWRVAKVRRCREESRC